MSKYSSEMQVLNALKIDNFHNMPKNKVKEFVSLIPHIDKNVIVQIASQLDSYENFARCMIMQLDDMCNDILKSNEQSQMETIRSYQYILYTLSKWLENEYLTFEEKKQIMLEMATIADHISEKDTENKYFLENIHKRNMALGIGATALGVLTLGVLGMLFFGGSDSDTDDSDTDDLGTDDDSLVLDDEFGFCDIWD